ncbi:hypothetical protein, partial [Streptomyces clavuligerus]
TTLTPFANDPTATTLNDLSRALNRMSAHADSRYSAVLSRETPSPWTDSRAACDHAHEHIQNTNRTLAAGSTPTPLDVRTVTYCVLAAIALFDDALRSGTPAPAAAHDSHHTAPVQDLSVFGIARAAAYLLGDGWEARPGLHNTRGVVRHSDGESYLLAAGDVGDMDPELYVENADARHVLWNTDGLDPATLALIVANTIRDLTLA